MDIDGMEAYLDEGGKLNHANAMDLLNEVNRLRREPYSALKSDDRKAIPLVTRSILEYQKAGTPKQIDELMSSDPPVGMLMLIRDMATDEATKIIHDLWINGFIIVKQVTGEDMDFTTEIGWLIDDGKFALGYSKGCQGFKFGTYTNETAIRFARQEDAERMISYMKNVIGFPTSIIEKLHAVDHAWHDET